MRVLQIINSLHIGGAEKLLIDSVPIYQQKEIEMDVLVLKDIMTPFWEKLQKETNGKINGLTKKSIYNVLLVLKIVPYLKKYDIVHVHLFPALYWVVFARMLSLSKVKVVYTEHNTKNRRRNNLFFRFIDSFIYHKLDVVIAITDGVKTELANHLKDNKDITVINNGINVSSFNINEKKQFNYFDNDDIKIIQVSSFTAQKDQKTVINSLKFLPENIKLLLVGAGPLLDEHKKMAEILNLSHRIIFLGNRVDIPELMNYADIVVLSSNWEGFGLAILEGMAAGKPAIVANIEGVREIVQEFGLLFQQGNAQDLALNINSLVNDSLYYAHVAEKCYERAQLYDINKMVDRHVNLYKNL